MKLSFYHIAIIVLRFKMTAFAYFSTGTIENKLSGLFLKFFANKRTLPPYTLTILDPTVYSLLPFVTYGNMKYHFRTSILVNLTLKLSFVTVADTDIGRHIEVSPFCTAS